MSSSTDKVWIRTSTLDAAISNGNGVAAAKKASPEGWGWTLGRLSAGAIEVTATTPAIVIIEDASSSHDQKKIEIPPELLFTKPSTKATPKRFGYGSSAKPGSGTGPNFGGSPGMGGGGRNFGVKKPAAAPAAAAPAVPVPNIVPANPSDVVVSKGAEGGDAPAPPHDLQALTYLHEPSVVHTLKARYAMDEIYTSTGPNILVALNPFKDTGMYEDDIVDKYASRGELEQSFLGTGQTSGKEELPPHVFRISDLTFRTMMSKIRASAGLGIVDMNTDYEESEEVIVDQSLLVSGESGAGKTVTTKHVLRYLASLSKRRGNKMMSGAAVGGAEGGLRNLVKAPDGRPSLVSQPSIRRPSVMRGRPGMGDKQMSWMRGAEVEEQILEANPILEAFGNARTLRNDNSSRFGKYIELQFKTTGSLIGANIETYLLEKVRLIHSEKGERNYHIFYELMTGASVEELKAYQLDKYEMKDFKLMNQSGTYLRRDGVDDQDEFDSLIDSMSTLNFNEQHIKNILLVTVACMHALNLSLVEPTPGTSDLESDSNHLDAFLSLLGLERNKLRDTLCSYELRIGNDVALRAQSKENAEKGLQSFTKAIYSSMFSHIVSHINEKINYVPPPGSRKKNGEKAGSIGILDIFGFESFKRNSFEQLCINYCNEALQQEFNTVVFKCQKLLYDAEGIDSSFIKFPDNQDCLDAIEEKGFGVLSILDDLSFTPQMTDDKFALNLYQRFDKKPTPRFQASPLQQGNKLFVINHYAGPVVYDIASFVEKNKEEIPRETASLLKSSTNPFVRSLVTWLGQGADAAADLPNTGPGAARGGKKTNTVGKHFSSQLKQLRTKIGKTTPYFVRCIKPNQELSADNFTPAVVVDQLKSLGVLEAVRVSRLGFSQNFSTRQFVRRYRLLACEQLSQMSDDSGLESCKIIVEEAVPQLSNLEDEARGVGIQIGKSKIFLRPRHADSMESLRNQKMIVAVIVIQCAWRVATARTIMDLKYKEAYIVKIQAQARCYIARRDFQLLILRMVSASLIQALLRGANQRAKFKVLLEQKREKERLAKEAEERLAKEAEERRIEEERLAKEMEEMRINEEILANEVDEKIREEKRLAQEAEVQKIREENRLAQEAEEQKIREEKETAEEVKREEEELALAEKTRREKEATDQEYLNAPDVLTSMISTANSERKSAYQEQDTIGSHPATNKVQQPNRSSRSSRFSKEKLTKAMSILQRRKSQRRLSQDATKKENDAQRGKNQAAAEASNNTTTTSARSSFLPSSKGMYEVVLPITEYGLMINITQFHGGVAFASYRSNSDGSVCNAQEYSLIRGVGDKIVSVNGEMCDGKVFGEIVGLLVKASAEDKGFSTLVFQEWMHAYSVNDM